MIAFTPTLCYNTADDGRTIDRDRKKDLRLATGMTTTAMAKPRKNESVDPEILLKICKGLKCDISDIMEIAKTEE